LAERNGIGPKPAGALQRNSLSVEQAQQQRATAELRDSRRGVKAAPVAAPKMWLLTAEFI